MKSFASDGNFNNQPHAGNNWDWISTETMFVQYESFHSNSPPVWFQYVVFAFSPMRWRWWILYWIQWNTWTMGSSCWSETAHLSTSTFPVSDQNRRSKLDCLRNCAALNQMPSDRLNCTFWSFLPRSPYGLRGIVVAWACGRAGGRAYKPP